MSDGHALTPRRRWLAITAATVVAQFCYWPVLVGAFPPGDDPTPNIALVVLGLALVPFALLTAAFGSGRRDAASATLKGMGLFLVIGVPLGVLLPAFFGTAIGLAAGGAAALRGPDAVRTMRWRGGAVVALAIYLLTLYLVAPAFGVFSGAVLPFGIHGLVDQGLEARQEKSGQQ